MAINPVGSQRGIAIPCASPGPFTLEDLTLLPIRIWTARLLVAICFVWPYFNFGLADTGMNLEVNCLPVFAAAALLPEVLWRDRRSILLALPVFGVAAVWATPAAVLRLAIAIVPLHFLLNLTRHLRARGQSLLPLGLAYRALQVFVLFCLVQTVDFEVHAVIPGWLSKVLVQIVPRYSGMPYDEFGVRGVQGWASEPAGAAMVCAAFALVAIFERPERRWRVLALFLSLLIMNKSIYAIFLTLLLGLASVLTLRHRLYSLLAILVLALATMFYVARSGRIAELQSSVLTDGLDRASNTELIRFAQLLYPLQQFPHIYRPPTLFATKVMEPIGLLALLAGYGSVPGIVWLVYIQRRNFRFAQVPLRPFALVAGLLLLIMVPPDLIPSILAVSIFCVPLRQSPGLRWTPETSPRGAS